MLIRENDTQALAMPGALRTILRSRTSHRGQLTRRPHNENTQN